MQQTGDGGGHGRDAKVPADVPAAGWRDILVRTVKESKADGAPLLAAGVAFYALLALAPALTALAGLYGLVADPADAARQVRDLLAAAPTEVRDLVEVQLTTAAERSQGGALAFMVIGALLALWSASSGVQHLIGAINTAYDEEETRGFVKVRGLALLLTAGAIVFLAVSIGVIALLPAVLADTALGDASRITIAILRWPALGLSMIGGLAVIYRVAPDREDPRWSWAGLGSVVATLLWLIGSVAFSVYSASFGKYETTYGALGAVVVVMLWLFLTAYVVVLGAELNAEAERQTRKDTTTGHGRSLGERGAEAADTVGPTAHEVKAGVKASADVSGSR
ncbi:MAG: YihY/virulence factor BrkB family protein [Acidimicrobiales bacterium]|nr:YihY/virulence factor BrkB family protein [Acidimicrobiales bacterium]